jgi:hypothetical protein
MRSALERRSAPVAIALAFFIAFTAGISVRDWGIAKGGGCTSHAAAPAAEPEPAK